MLLSHELPAEAAHQYLLHPEDDTRQHLSIGSHLP